jgi:hypothetical protein
MKFPCIFLLAMFSATVLFAQSPQFTSIALVSPTLYANPSGALKPGAIYKYANAGGGGSNKIDAYVQIVKSSNKHAYAGTQDDNVGLYAFDNLASVNNPGGYDSSFQPVVSSSRTNASGLWTSGSCGYGSVQISHSADQNYLVHFRIYFKKAGTQVDTALNIKAAFIDIDGFGNGTEAEQDAFMPGVSYNLDPHTTLSLTERSDGLINAEGKPSNVTGLQFSLTSSIVQVTYLHRTFIDFAMGMNTHNANAYGDCYPGVSGGRLTSVSFATQPTGLTNITPTALSLSGTVWNDADGSANNTFNNIKTSLEAGTNGSGLYVYAIDVATNAVVGKATVGADGAWAMSNVAKDFAIKLTLSKTNVEAGAVNPALLTVNTGWVATSPLTRPSFVPAAAAGANTYIANLDFGIEQTPTSIPYNGIIPSPALNAVKVLNSPAAGFPPLTGTDPEDGALGAFYTLVVKSLTMNGNELYYGSAEPGTLLKARDTIYNYNPQYLRIRFSGSHSLSASFTFQFLDLAEAGGTIAMYKLTWGTALPITLRSFEVQKAGLNALLTWTVENSNSNTTITHIERSANGLDWLRIGEVLTQRNTPQAEYQFTDYQTLPGSNYYRLVMSDADGSDQYSAIGKLTFGTQSGVSIYPNPAGSTISIRSQDQRAITSVTIMNQAGAVVYSGDGSNTRIDVSALAPGNYLLRVVAGGEVAILKMVRQ